MQVFLKRRRKQKKLHTKDLIEAHSAGRGRLQYLRKEFQATSNLGYLKNKRSYIVTTPENFSFIHDADEAMNCIASLLAIPRNSKLKPRAKEIHIDQRRCKTIGLGATAVFDVCALLIRSEQRLRSKGYRFTGSFPDDEQVCNQVKVMGITKHLEVAGTNAPKEFEDNVVQLPLQRGRKRNEDWKGKNDQESVSSRLAKYLNECFTTASSFSLTQSATRQILKWTGEIITNAEEHSGVDDWYAMACMLPMKTTSSAIIGKCELVIFGFGKSIYQTLSSSSTPQDLREQIESLVTEHTKSGFFQHKYKPEDLWTLYALQEGVSSRHSVSAPGGTGTVRLIEAFQTLGQTVDDDKKPEMVLLSGSTRIIFNQRYKMQPEDVEGGPRNIIAFNAQNSLREKPDPKCVGSIEGFFPGTLLSFKFYVDQRFLETLPIQV